MRPRTSTIPQDLEQLRANPSHWTWYGSYSCAADPRLMVRARIGLGWTLNEAHPHASRVKASILLFVLAMAVGLAVFVRAT